MSHLLRRELVRDLPTAVRGEGIYLFDRDGRRYLDAGGGGVSCLGHNATDVISAITDQLGRLAYVNNSVFTNEAAEAAADCLAREAPPLLDQVYFVSGGSEAVEVALKIARQYFVEIGEPERRIIVSRWHSFHGNTIGAMSAGGDPARHALFKPLLFKTEHIAACHVHRDERLNESPEAYGERVAGELEALVEEHGPRAVAAFIAETVVGSTLGAVPAVPGYFRRIREICDRYGIVFILDEVMCGMGRTGTLFAFEQEGVVPDMVCISKALGAGYVPIAGTVISRKIGDALACGTGVLQHFHTYQAHPVACAAARAVLARITQPALLRHVREMGERLLRQLRANIGQHPNVADIRGRGLMIGIEFDHDGVKINSAVRREAMALGLTVTGPIGAVADCITLTPPYVATEDEIDRLAELFVQAVNLAIARPETVQRVAGQ